MALNEQAVRLLETKMFACLFPDRQVSSHAQGVPGCRNVGSAHGHIERPPAGQRVREHISSTRSQLTRHNTFY